MRLGQSGLKVSKIILGCMSYGMSWLKQMSHWTGTTDHGTGSPEWQTWVLPEEEGIKHIKVAYDAGINTFDTANVSLTIERSPLFECLTVARFIPMAFLK